MKPTFRKVYSGPGYWTRRRPIPVRCWEFKPLTSPIDFEALFADIYRVVRARDVIPQSESCVSPTGRHEGDELRLPLGASIRAG